MATVDDDVLISRMAPLDDPLTRFFWTSGSDGQLRFLCCGSCGYFNHPPGPRCARCLSAELSPRAVSGLGTVHTFTVNHQQWVPGQAPYVIAIVRLDEQEDLQLTTNVCGCDWAEVTVGMRVRVCFLHRNDVWYPLFEPVQEAR
jgi:uncharacterized OB-fold protein